MVYVNVFGLEVGTAGDAIIVHSELVYKGGAGSKCDDAARDWKPDAKASAAAKAGVGGTKMWKSGFKVTTFPGVAQEGRPGSPVEFLRRQAAMLAVLEKHGLAGSMKSSWASGDGTQAWAGVKIKEDPTGLTAKKLLVELQSAFKEREAATEHEDEMEDEEDEGEVKAKMKTKKKKKKKAEKGSEAATAEDPPEPEGEK